jgi:hypothetical protein
MQIKIQNESDNLVLKKKKNLYYLEDRKMKSVESQFQQWNVKSRNTSN